VRKRIERKGEKGREEDDYFNKFPPALSLLPLSSSSLPLSFLPLNPPHYVSLCFLSLIPIHPPHYLSPSFLSVIHEGWRGGEND
jgi:hypothetical protein